MLLTIVFKMLTVNEHLLFIFKHQIYFFLKKYTYHKMIHVLNQTYFYLLCCISLQLFSTTFIRLVFSCPVEKVCSSGPLTFLRSPLPPTLPT